MKIIHLILIGLFLMVRSEFVYAQIRSENFQLEKGKVLTSFSLSITGANRDDSFNQDFEKEMSFSQYQLSVHYLIVKNIGVGIRLNQITQSAYYESFDDAFEPNTRKDRLFDYGLQIGYFREFTIKDSDKMIFLINASVLRSKLQSEVDYNTSQDLKSPPRYSPKYAISAGIVKPLGKRIALRIDLERSSEREEIGFFRYTENGNIENIQETKWPVNYRLNAGLTLAF